MSDNQTTCVLPLSVAQFITAVGLVTARIGLESNTTGFEARHEVLRRVIGLLCNFLPSADIPFNFIDLVSIFERLTPLITF